jgi:glyoxylate reductase
MTDAKPKLLVTRKLPDAVLEHAERHYDASLNADDVPHGPEQLVALGADMDGILAAPGDSLTTQVIEGLDDSVRIIAIFSVGYEHIDTDAAKTRGITITNTPGVLTESTAEIAMLLLLGAARRASEGDALVRAGGWHG